jgi:hypothetical protein
MIIWSMACSRLFDVLSASGQIWMYPVKVSTAKMALWLPLSVSGMFGMMSMDHVVRGAWMMGISASS